MNQDDDRFSCRSEYFEAPEDIPINPSQAPTLGDVINQRFSRREILKGALGVVAIGALAPLPLMRNADAAEKIDSFAFMGIEHGADQTHHVAPGYSADVLMRWGDSAVPGAQVFDPMAHTAVAQLKQYGRNNDYVGFVPLSFGSNSSDHGLLCINHERTPMRN